MRFCARNIRIPPDVAPRGGMKEFRFCVWPDARDPGRNLPNAPDFTWAIWQSRADTGHAIRLNLIMRDFRSPQPAPLETGRFVVGTRCGKVMEGAGGPLRIQAFAAVA